MQTLKVWIFPNGSTEIEVDEKAIVSQSELNVIVKKIYNKEIDSRVYYDEKPAILYQVQGGIGVKNVGFIAPILFNPLADLFLALCKE